MLLCCFLKGADLGRPRAWWGSPMWTANHHSSMAWPAIPGTFPGSDVHSRCRLEARSRASDVHSICYTYNRYAGLVHEPSIRHILEYVLPNYRRSASMINSGLIQSCSRLNYARLASLELQRKMQLWLSFAPIARNRRKSSAQLRSRTEVLTAVRKYT